MSGKRAVLVLSMMAACAAAVFPQGAASAVDPSPAMIASGG
jgi:hypothetical protein